MIIYLNEEEQEKKQLNNNRKRQLNLAPAAHRRPANVMLGPSHFSQFIIIIQIAIQAQVLGADSMRVYSRFCVSDQSLAHRMALSIHHFHEFEKAKVQIVNCYRFELETSGSFNRFDTPYISAISVC